jgi:hypothetical protein
MVMTQLDKWMFNQRHGGATFLHPKERQRLYDFRQLLTKDPNFVVNKQKLMQPVFDPESRDQVNMRSAKGNWLTQLIGRESTYEGRGL